VKADDTPEEIRSTVVKGVLVDIHLRENYPATLEIHNGKITKINREASAAEDAPFIIPGFIDSHVHIESSMLTPCEFARMAVLHGTIACVSDPHEIANVLGLEGIDFMLENAAHSPLKFCFGAPSCVPATPFETAGGKLDSGDIRSLLNRPQIGYLSEMMNYPGVLNGDAEVLAKIAAAREAEKPVDGHAPGLRGKSAQRYAKAGISTDHECFTLGEAMDKIEAGMWILIREGSAAKNFEALSPLLKSHPGRCMFCTDDMHPDSLLHGHINRIAARAVASEADLYDVLRCASLHPATHYKLPVGLLREGDAADFALVSDLKEFQVLETWIDGKPVAKKSESLLPQVSVVPTNRFRSFRVMEDELKIYIAPPSARARVIKAADGELITGSFSMTLSAPQGVLLPDLENDILKIAVFNRYASAQPALGFIHGFGLVDGAIASSVAHDSHNVVAVGTDDESLAEALNLVAQSKGGLAAVGSDELLCLPLPIAGLMTDRDGPATAHSYAELDLFVKKNLCSPLSAPFMTLSFMALLVIPDLKLGDLGLFSGTKFQPVDLIGEDPATHAEP
jgi:adenine deaminase